MQHYLTVINASEKKEETLNEIIRKEQNTIPNLINNVLTLTLLIVVIFAVVQGRYILKETKVYQYCPDTGIYTELNNTNQLYGGLQWDYLPEIKNSNS